MSNGTTVMSVAEYRRLVTENRKPSPNTASKYGNTRTADGFDSAKEKRIFAQLEMMRGAASPDERIVKIERQKRFELIEKQPGERAVHYVADFVVEFASGAISVIDVKSAVTRKIPSYIIKRKLMLERHGIKIREM